MFTELCLAFRITQPQGFPEVKGKQQLEGSGSGWALGVLEIEPKMEVYEGVWKVFSHVTVLVTLTMAGIFPYSPCTNLIEPVVVAAQMTCSSED